MRLLFLLLLGLLGAFPGVSRAQSDTPERVIVGGLSFPCVGCRLQQGELGCTLLISEKHEPLSCEQAIPVLIEALIKRGDEEQGPDPVRIKQYLVEQRATPPTAEGLLLLLMQTSKGYKLLLRDAPQLVKLYEGSFAELILAGKGSPGLWKTLWNLPQITGAELDVRLAAAIALRHPALSLEDVFKRLAQSQVKDLQDLLRLAEVYQQAGKEDAAKTVRSVHAKLTDCLARSEICADIEKNGLSPAMTAYVQSFRVERLLQSAFRLGEPIEVLDALKNIAQPERQSAAYHRHLLSALEQAQESRLPRVRAQLVSEERLKFLAEAARVDRALAYVLGDILAKAGNEALIQEEVRESLRLLEWSLNVHPEPIEERTTLISRLTRSSALSDVPELHRLFTALVSPASAIYSESSSLPTFYWFILALSLACLWACFIFLMRRRRRALEQRSLEHEVLQWREERERRDLRKFFSLSNLCSQEELLRQYRRLAEELHPDSGAGFGKEFAELTQKYERAKEVLFAREDRNGN